MHPSLRPEAHPAVVAFVAAMTAAGIEPVPLLERKVRRWRGEVLAPTDLRGWSYAVAPRFGPNNELGYYVALTTGMTVRVGLSPTPLTREARKIAGSEHRVEFLHESAIGEDPDLDAEFRVERVKKYGAAPSADHPVDSVLAERLAAFDAGFVSVTEYRAYLEGAPVEWMRAWETGEVS